MVAIKDIVSLRAIVGDPSLIPCLYPEYLGYGGSYLCRLLAGPKWRPIRVVPAIQAPVIPWETLLVEGESLDDPPLHRVLSREEVGRRRYYPPIAIDLAWAGPRFGVAFTILRSVLVGDELRVFKEAMNKLGSMGYIGEGRLRKDLKALEGWSKVNGDFLPGWKSLVGLNTCGGYLPAPAISDFLIDVREWVTAPRGFSPEAEVPGWHECFKEALTEFFVGVAPISPSRSPEDFLGSGDWARAGSANWPVTVKAVNYVTGETIQVRKTKNLLAMAISRGELLDAFWSEEAHPGRALVKREATKARAVLITDLPSYLKMSWISDALEPALRHNEWTSLLFSGRKLSELWADLALRADDPVWWKLPIDQSNFDHNISLVMIGDCLNAIDAVLLDPQMKLVLSMIRKVLVDSPPGVYVGDLLVAVSKGILSGWRWTALLDSMCNFGQIRGTMLWLQRSGVIAYLEIRKNLLVQGDDARLLVNNPAVGIAICEVLRTCGFKINPNKTWLSPLRDEYLRRVGTTSGGRSRCCGYPARSMLSIMWRNPISPQGNSLQEVLSGISQRWKELIGRGADPDACVRHMRDEVLRVSGARSTEAWGWLATPAYLGGGDWWWLSVPSYFSIVTKTVPRPIELYGLEPVMRDCTWASRILGLTPSPPIIQAVAEQALGAIESYAPGMLSTKQEASFIRAGHPKGWKAGYRFPATSVEHLCPVSARFNSAFLAQVSNIPGWIWKTVMHQALIRKLVHPDTVHRYMTSGMEGYSRHIRRVHGVHVWLSWLSGQLDLPVRTWPGFGSSFLGGMVGPEKRIILRRALTASRPVRMSGLFSLAHWFWSIQKEPRFYVQAMIGA